MASEFRTALDLTVSECDARDLPRLYPGDTITIRFKVRVNGEAIDLTGYVIVMTARRRLSDSSEFVFVRRSLDDIAGHVPTLKQIAIDADQTVEAIDEDGNPIGRGCFELRFKTADESVLLAAQGRSDFDIVLQNPLGDRFTFASGRLEIPWRATRGSQFV